VPDFTAPQAHWLPGDPDDLNDAPFWATLDLDLREDSPEAPIRYYNGELQLRIKDIGADGLGVPWGHTRIYSNRLSNSYDFGNGYNWLVHEQPRLVRLKTPLAKIKKFHEQEQPPPRGEPTGCTTVLLRGTRNALWFDEYGEGDSRHWYPRFGARHCLSYEGGKRCRFHLTAPNGHRWEFFDFTYPHSKALQLAGLTLAERLARVPGALVRHQGPGGQEARLTYQDCRLQTVDRFASSGAANGATLGASALVETYTYTYFPPGPHENRVRYVTLSRQGKPIARAEYLYYDQAKPFGNEGDLKLAVRQLPRDEKGERWNNIDVHYYRYEQKPRDTYCQGMLQMVVGPEHFRRAVKQEVGTNELQSIASASLADLAAKYADNSDLILHAPTRPLADLFIEYDEKRRVATLYMNGGGRMHRFQYKEGFDEINYNAWRRKCLETRADARSQRLVYSSFVGRNILTCLMGDGGSWAQYRIYDIQDGALRLDTAPSGVVKFSEAATVPPPSQAGAYISKAVSTQQPGQAADISGLHVELKTSDGLFQFLDYEGSRSLSDVRRSNNNASASAFQMHHLAHYEYNVRLIGCSPNPTCSLGVPFLTKAVLRAGASKAAMTTFDYEWLGGWWTQMIKRTATLPAVRVEENGSGTPDQIIERFEAHGYREERIDERQVVTKWSYEIAKDTVKQMIEDAGPKGSPRTTDFESDDLGRTTRVLAGKNDVVTNLSPDRVWHRRTAVWHVYRDVEGEVYTAHGSVAALGGGSDEVIPPLALTRLDRAGRVTDEIEVAQAPAIWPPPASGCKQSLWSRWTRHEFDDQDQHRWTRVYHDTPASGEGVPSANYDETAFTYDALYRLQTVSSPGGTVTKTTYEARGLPVRIEVGTKAELRLVTYLRYDHGWPGGNGNLTLRVDYADGTAALARPTQFSYAEYTYWGLDNVFGILLPEANPASPLRHVVENLPSGPPYSRLDPFDRPRLWRWDGVSSGAHDEALYRYDRLGARTARVALGTSLGQPLDEAYQYDGLARPQRVDRGKVVAGMPSGTLSTPQVAVRKFAQQWLLDQQDNWWTLLEDLDGNGAYDAYQVRLHERSNRITNLWQSPPSSWKVPQYDAVGNVTRVPDLSGAGQDLTCQYDGWNRLVRVKRAGKTLAEDEYDGLGRRTVERTFTASGNPLPRHFYYTHDCRLLEEREPTPGQLPGQARASRRYVWGLRGPDDLLFRDRRYTATGNLRDRLYALPDANGDITALYNPASSGTGVPLGVVERFWYDPYGKPLYFSPTFTAKPQSNYGWNVLYGGYYYDAETGLYLVRNRIYHPLYGRWLQIDPEGFTDSYNLYQYCLSSPLTYLDPTGEILPLIIPMIVIGLAGVAAAHYGAHEMDVASRSGDMARYERGTAWFAGGVAGVGAAIAIPAAAATFTGVAGAFGTTAAGTSTFLGTGGWTAIAGSTASGAVGGAISGAFAEGLTTYGFGGSPEESIYSTGAGAAQGGFYGGIGGLVAGPVLWRLGAGLGGTALSGFAGGAAAGAVQGAIETGSISRALESAGFGGLPGGLSAGVGWGIGRASGWIRPLGPYPERSLGRLPHRFMVRTIRPDPRSRIWNAPRTFFQRPVAWAVPRAPAQGSCRLTYGGRGTRPRFHRHHVLPHELGGPDVRAYVRHVRIERHAITHPDVHVRAYGPGTLVYRKRVMVRENGGFSSWLGTLDLSRLVLQPPAPNEAILRVESHFGVRLPRRYREFLHDSDGALLQLRDSYIVLFSVVHSVGGTTLERYNSVASSPLFLIGTQDAGLDLGFVLSDIRRTELDTAPLCVYVDDEICWTARSFEEFLGDLSRLGPDDEYEPSFLKDHHPVCWKYEPSGDRQR